VDISSDALLNRINEHYLDKHTASSAANNFLKASKPKEEQKDEKKDEVFPFPTILSYQVDKYASLPQIHVLMISLKISTLFVTDHGALCGMITMQKLSDLMMETETSGKKFLRWAVRAPIKSISKHTPKYRKKSPKMEAVEPSETEMSETEDERV